MTVPGRAFTIWTAIWRLANEPWNTTDRRRTNSSSRGHPLRHDEQVMVGPSLVTEIVGQLADHVDTETANGAIFDRLVDIDLGREEGIEWARVILDLDAEFRGGGVETNRDPARLIRGVSVIDDIGQTLLERDVEVGGYFRGDALADRDLVEERVSPGDLGQPIMQDDFHEIR
jgi:hypothetical protein